MEVEALAGGKLKGSDVGCDYYPCHFEGQDCTWCYCPFYPCADSHTQGRFKVSKRTGREVWSCKDCTWIHRREVAQTVLEGMRDVRGESQDDLSELRSKILGRGIP